MRSVRVALALAAALALAGCADESQSQSPSQAQSPSRRDVPGADFVRGTFGIAQGEAPRTDDEKRYAEIVEQVIAEIEDRYPGRLASIAADFESYDQDRTLAAKKLLDDTIEDIRRQSEEQSNRALVATQSIADDIVAREQQLLCEHPKGADGQPLHLGQVNGQYGDGRTGFSGRARDALDLVDTHGLNPLNTLSRVDSGELTVDPESRLGAYAATRGYPQGTVGHAVHAAIGTIFVTFGNWGEERIGRVFNSPEARALYDQPVASCAGQQMAMLEYQYWQDVKAEDGWSAGGNLGSMFNPTARDFLQRRVFNLFPGR